MKTLLSWCRAASLVALLLLFLPTFATGQTLPKVSCDTAGQLYHAPEIFGARRATLNAACGSYQLLLQRQDTTWSEKQLLAYLLHGTLPTDTAIVTPPPPPPPDTTTIPPTSAWTFCVNAGNVCQFTGLRVVRLADKTAAHVVTQTAYGLVPCADYGFNANLQGTLHCDYGPALFDTLTVSVAMGPLTAPTIVVPKGSPGVSVAQAQSGGGNGVHTDGSGSVRFVCSLTKFAFDDPIVFPGQPGKSHLHMFFGNTALTAFTDSSTIATQGNSTCPGGILNRTAYWTPAMIDAAGRAIMPERATFYYKTGYNMPPAKTQPLPNGLRMIAGSKDATGVQQVPGPLQVVNWSCILHGADGGIVIPNCAVGDTVRLTVYFPSCWDGVHLDSPDHKAHMAYPDFSAGSCPSTHPVQVPQISEHFDWPVQPGMNASTWHLSSDSDLSKPGHSGHADWMMGWDSATMAAFVQNCLQKALDCGVGGIGGNKSLF